MCLECSFSSFSTDTGCTVELVSSDSSSSCVQYTETINRSDNGTAEGCVSGVTAGEYVVRVYDQSSSELVHEVDNVTVSILQLPLPTTTTLSFSSTTRTTLLTRDTLSSSSAIPRTMDSSPSKGSQN